MDLEIDDRPQKILKRELELDFWTKPPTHEEGLTIPDQQAGVNIDQLNRKLSLSTNKEGLQIKKLSLREQLITCRHAQKSVTIERNKLEEIKQSKVSLYKEAVSNAFLTAVDLELK